MTMKPSEIIREGRNQLFERGHAVRTYENHEGALCSLGALRVAACDSTWFDRLLQSENIGAYESATEFLARAIVGAVGAGMHAIAIFNDMPGRTFDEVIDAFDEAEKLAEIEERA